MYVWLGWTRLYFTSLFIRNFSVSFETFKFSFFFCVWQSSGREVPRLFFFWKYSFCLERGSVVWRQYKGRWIFRVFSCVLVVVAFFHISFFFWLVEIGKQRSLCFDTICIYQLSINSFFMCSPQKCFVEI